MAVPLPLTHTLELNAGTADTDTGPHLQANWTWAPSAVDREQVSRLSRLWFEALAGICAHVRRGGGGLTPSDIAPARLSQQQIDELCRHYRVADVLPLTPLQQGLLFHASAAQGSGDDVYAVQLDIAMSGPLDPHRLRDAVHTVVTRHPNLAARFCERFDEPVQIIPADPERRGGMSSSTAATAMSRSRSSGCAPPNAPRSAISPTRRPFGWLLIRTASGPAPVCAHQSPHLDGWLVAADPAAGNICQLLRASAARGRAVSQVCQLAGGRDRDAAQAAWREVLAGFDTPTLVGPPDRLGLGREASNRSRVSEEITRALGELARSHHTTVSTVLQAAWAQLLMWLTGQHDVAFGAVVSGRPAEVVGADSMVGLLINTVPVRANITAGNHHHRPAGAAAKRPQPHARASAPGA